MVSEIHCTLMSNEFEVRTEDSTKYNAKVLKQTVNSLQTVCSLSELFTWHVAYFIEAFPCAFTGQLSSAGDGSTLPEPNFTKDPIEPFSPVLKLLQGQSSLLTLLHN